jgi:hypothetical protein
LILPEESRQEFVLLSIIRFFINAHVFGPAVYRSYSPTSTEK